MPSDVRASPSVPVIFFSDIESGPKIGGEGSNGAYVTVYGQNFGPSQGSSYVTVGGGQATNYKIWGTWLWYQKITFQLGPNAATGNIVVHTPDGDSNSVPFTVRSGNIYFVATSGNDNNNGSFASPWRTIPHAVQTAGAGSIIYAMNGVSQTTDDGEGWNAALTLRAEWCQGTAANPKALIAYPGATATIGNPSGTSPSSGIRGTDFTASGGACGGNWVFAELNLRGSESVTVNGPSTNWRFIGNDVSNPQAGGGGGGGAAWETSMATYVKCLGNYGHDLNLATTDRLVQGFYLSTDSNHAEMAWNMIANAKGRAGIQVHSSPLSSGNGYAMYDISVHDNVVHDIAEEGIIIDTVDPSKGPVTVYNNLVYNVGKDGQSAGAIYRAVSSDFDDSHGVGTGTVDFYHNTIFNYNGGPAFGGSFELHQGQLLVDRLRNNLILSSGNPYFYEESSDTSYHSCSSTDTPSACKNLIGSNNILYGAGAPTFTNLITGSINQDPRLVSVAGYNAHLQPGSPAIDAGVAMAGLNHDLDWAPRPQGAGYDIGAYEFVNGSYTPPSDTVPPSVSITSPSNGATVSGVVSIVASASDDVGVLGVQFMVEGSPLGAEDASAPYDYSWNTTLMTNGVYTLTAVARDAYNQNTSSPVAVTVANDKTPPVRSNGQPSGTIAAGTTQVTMSLGTDESATCKYDNASRSYASMRNTFSTTGGTSHSNLLTGLTARNYVYYVRCTDAYGNANTNNFLINFTIPAGSDTTPPTISGVSSSSVSSNSASVAWTTNEAADSQAEYGTTTGYGSNTTLNSTLTLSHAVQISGLASNTLYHYRVRSADAAGNVRLSPDYTFTTLAADTTPPTVPTGLAANAVSSTQINLNWIASTDNVAVAGYRIYRGGALAGSTSLTSYADTGLSPSTAYSYTVTAYDMSGLNSTSSSPATATTQNASSSSGAPVLFFSDLTWGPKTGWEGSATKGAAVTVWGKRFGSPRGASYVTVNGAQLSSDADYAEWDATGPARGLERITFWLNSNCQDGSGTITVTVNGVTSNALPFTVTNGVIYFVSVADGSNSNNGLYSTARGGGSGPFKDIYMFNPGQDGFHTSANRNPSGDGQYIVYVRAGTYTTMDPAGDIAFVSLRGPYGGPTKQKALIGYPGETPTINTKSATRGLIWNANYSPYGRNSYFTYSKLYGVGGTAPIDFWGDYNRVIGCTWQDYLDDAWTGVVLVRNSYYSYVYGNYFNHNGHDSFKHNIYVKTVGPSDTPGPEGTEYTYIGWNEIANPVASDTHGGAIFISKSSDALNKVNRNIFIHDNYLHDGNTELLYTGDNTVISDIYVYNNVFSGGSPSSGGIFIAWDTDSIYFYNNVFYQIGGSGQPMIAEQGYSHSYFKNNIWYAKPNQAFYSGTTYYAGESANTDHDLFYNPGGATTPPSGDGMTSVNSVIGDPRFVNAAASDFRLQSNSPAIDAGTGAVSSMVGWDYDYILRPQGAGYDIGAYEYVSGAPDTTPPVLSYGSPSGTLAMGTTQATMSLTTNEAAACKYSATPNTAYSSMANTFSATGGTSHSTTLSGLQNGQNYNYYARCQDPSGNANTNDYAISFSVAADTTPPVISGINAVPARTTAVISWTTNELSNSSVNYGVSVSMGMTAADASMVTSHSISLSGLSEATLYYYAVKSCDASGNCNTSSTRNFTTTSSPDTTPPSVLITSPSDGVNVNGMVSITATASDNVAVSYVEFYRDGSLLGTDYSSPYSYLWNTSGETNGGHTLMARAADASNNYGTNAITVTVNNVVPDTTPPSQVTGLTATATSPSQINLAWNAATDNVGVAGYRVYRCQGAGCTSNANVANMTITSYQNGGLAASTTYRYRVAAFDAAGNLGSMSSIATATTQSPPDTTPPSVSITAPANGATVSGIVAVSATASDNVAVTGVQFMVDGSNISGEDTSSPYSVQWNSSTVANGQHSLSARARDAAGNTATASAAVIVANVIVNETVPPSITNVSAAASWDTAVIKWNTNEPANSSVNYGTSLSLGNLASDPLLVTSHSVSLTNLSQATLYYYNVKSCDASGNCNVSSTRNFTTTSAPDLTPPAVSITFPSNGMIVSGTVNITADASDNVGVSYVEFYRDGTLLSTGYSSTYSYLWNTAAETNGQHTLMARAVDASGNSFNSTISVSVNNAQPPGPSGGGGPGGTSGSSQPPKDKTPPTTPANVAAKVVSSFVVNLTWSPSTDNVGVIGYKVYRNGVYVGTAKNNSYSDTGLSPGARYNYTVLAYDASDNPSNQTSAVSATTPTEPLTIPPTDGQTGESGQQPQAGGGNATQEAGLLQALISTASQYPLQYAAFFVAFVVIILSIVMLHRRGNKKRQEGKKEEPEKNPGEENH